MQVDPVAISIDGKLIPPFYAQISIINPSLHYAAGVVFEGMRCNHSADESKNFIFRLDDHVDRFFESLKIEKIPAKFSKEGIKSAIRGVCMLSVIEKGHKDFYIRPHTYLEDKIMGLYQSKTPVHFAVESWVWDNYHGKSALENGARVWVSKYKKYANDPELERWRAKSSTNYGRYGVMEHNRAKDNGYDDALFEDSNGNIAEAASSNIFFAKNGKVMTPSKETAILFGITRRSVMELLSREYGPVQEVELPIEELFWMDEVFLTGTAARIVPVVSITDNDGRDHHIGDGKPGPITKKAYDLYMKAIRGELPEFNHWLTPVEE